MPRTAWIVILLLLAVAPAGGQTYITSDITTSELWTEPCCPYVIQADVEITNDSTLSIQAGVTVVFDGDYTLSTAWGSAIIATGTVTEGILFTSNAGTPQPGDWGWVQVSGPNPSSFTYCTFEYAESGLRPNFGDPTITHCTIRSCVSSGLFCAGASPTVTYCDIYANRDGIGISNNESNPVINYCNIYDNTHWNVYTFSYPAPARTINCENNWWGTDVEATIQQEIYDSNDNGAIYVTVDYDPWWVEQPLEETTWGQLKALFSN